MVAIGDTLPSRTMAECHARQFYRRIDSVRLISDSQILRLLLCLSRNERRAEGQVMEHAALDVSTILSRLAEHSTRPRYAFMVLNLISEAAGPSGAVGPEVVSKGVALPVRDWLSDALA